MSTARFTSKLTDKQKRFVQCANDLAGVLMQPCFSAPESIFSNALLASAASRSIKQNWLPWPHAPEIRTVSFDDFNLFGCFFHNNNLLFFFAKSVDLTAHNMQIIFNFNHKIETHEYP